MNPNDAEILGEAEWHLYEKTEASKRRSDSWRNGTERNTDPGFEPSGGNGVIVDGLSYGATVNVTEFEGEVNRVVEAMLWHNGDSNRQGRVAQDRGGRNRRRRNAEIGSRGWWSWRNGVSSAACQDGQR